MRLHLLDDNEDLPAADCPKALALIDTTRDLHFQARAYIETQGLDAEIFLPGSVWATLVDHNSFLNWNCDFVNYVKTFSPFSGFHSLMWGQLNAPADSELAIDATRTADFYSKYLTGQLAAATLPPILERDFDLSARMRRSGPALIEKYDRLLEGVPEKYHVHLPKRAGEIGILHNGHVINSDLLAFQSRMNALYGAGALDHLEHVIAETGRATYAEIGCGAAQFANALHTCFGGRLDVSLIDLPSVMANGCAYLSCTIGPDAVSVVTDGTAAPPGRPIVYVANYLIPAYEHNFPPFDLVHNANSLNEMTDRQVTYYLEFVRAHLAPQGCFHLAGTFKIYDYHEDVIAAAARAFPSHRLCLDATIGPARVLDPRHMFCYASSNEHA